MERKPPKPRLVPTGIRFDLTSKRIMPIAFTNAESPEIILMYEETCLWLPKKMASKLGLDLPSEKGVRKPCIEMCSWTQDGAANWRQNLCVCTKPIGYLDSLHLTHAVWLMDLLYARQRDFRIFNYRRGTPAEFLTLQFTVRGAYSHAYMVDATMDNDPVSSRPIIIPTHYEVPADLVPRNRIHWSLSNIQCIDASPSIGPRCECPYEAPRMNAAAFVPIVV
jgi:hypothetical protein